MSVAKWLCLRVIMQEHPSSISVGSQFLIIVLRNFGSEAVGTSNFVVLVEDSDTGGPSSITVRIKYLFAFQIWCCELCVENQWGGYRKHYFFFFLSFEGALNVVGWRLVGWCRKFHLRPAAIPSFCSWFFRKLVRLNPWVQGKYLAIQPSLVTAWLLAIFASPIHPVDEFIPLSLVLLKEIRTLGESKVLSFCFWC